MKLIFKIFVSFILVFLLEKICFEIYFIDQVQSIAHFFKLLINGFSMDLAISALFTLPFLVFYLLMQVFHNAKQIINNIQSIFWFILVLFSIIITISDIGLYQSWSCKTNTRAIANMLKINDLFHLILDYKYIYLFIFIVISGLLLWKCKSILFANLNHKSIRIPYFIFNFLMAAFVLIICSRGGFQKIPINKNWIFKTPIAFDNYTMLNSTWNFFDVLSHYKKPINYNFFNSKNLNQILDEIKPQSHFLDSLSRISNPNIIIIAVESLSADVIASLGGESNICNGLEQLKHEGIWFTNCYASGYRTEQGLTALISGMHAQPKNSILQEFGPFNKLPNLLKVSKQKGYQTYYCMGGRLAFDNVGSYMNDAGLTEIWHGANTDYIKRSHWGAYDEELFDKMSMIQNQSKEPYFLLSSTITSHEWFDAKVFQKFDLKRDAVNNGYRNCVAYTDSCILDYVSKFKKSKQYNNSIVIITADHGAVFPKSRQYNEAARYKIPCLIIGGALKAKWNNVIVDRYVSQSDIAYTLAHELGLKIDFYPISRHLLDSNTNFSYYTFDHGFGILNQNGILIYDLNFNKKLVQKGTEYHVSKMEQWGKAILQYQNIKLNELNSK